MRPGKGKPLPKNVLLNFFPAAFKMSTVHEILCKLSLEGDVSISFSLCVIFANWTSLDTTPFPWASKKMGQNSDSHSPLGSPFPPLL